MAWPFRNYEDCFVYDLISIMYFQLLLLLASHAWTASGFIINTSCPRLCSCFGDFIECDNRQLTKVPVFPRYIGHSPYLNIILSYNRLTTITAHVFENISAVTTQDISINLDHNFISVIEIGAFAGIENLVKDLDLENNYLTHLPLALKELSSVESIDLLGNPLLNLDASVLAALSNTLKIFNADINHFASFPDDINLLSTLTILRMTGFNFTTMNSIAFHGFKDTLTTLHISHTKFHRVPAAVCRLTNLDSLTLDFSPSLGQYSGYIFEKCRRPFASVTYVSLANDQLTTIPSLVSIFPKLRVLNLKSNALHVIKNYSFIGVNSLVYLNLNGNNFTHIPSAVNQAVNLQTLSLGYNQIRTVNDGDLLNLQNLTRLNLNDNPLAYISPSAFAHTPFLNYINMIVTKLDQIPKAVIGLKHLRNILLNGKPINCSCTAMNYLKPWNVTRSNMVATCSSGTSVKAYLTTQLPKCP